MYAIVRTGGKQYQVASGDTLRVEKLTGEVGETVELSDVLLIADGDNIRVGTPAV
ncbi:50S ribosomal protein L21, partial [Desulfobulbus sp. US2]|nr:50S ribosomal protein L21 [Desulfobulbus sp. US2]